MTVGHVETQKVWVKNVDLPINPSSHGSFHCFHSHLPREQKHFADYQ